MLLDAIAVETISTRFAALSWQQRLAALSEWNESAVAFSTSFSFEDQAITHVIATQKLPIRIFTLDTGRLFEETHKLHQATREKYNIIIETYVPDAAEIEAFVNKNGINGFYNSIENRKECCKIRKVLPLQRALKGVDIWISGLRREHSDVRSNLGAAEWDEGNHVVKLYPLIDVSADEVWKFIKENNIPYNPMHEQGFPSIGCAPCTRAIAADEHPRAGRWWWEQGEQECGLHMVDGKLTRVKNA
ncbi:MAG: phosphoadenylyl-sulfate reductase [Alphaproteobacteria bacterium]|nr:phosphoadenylyl-sulfate reductase [Alphaproteobacteria bacterium]